MNCHECRDLLSDYLDGAVGPSVKQRMDEHLRVCAPCAAVQTDLQRMLTACETAFHPVGRPTVRLRPARISEPLTPSGSWRKRFTERYVEIRLSLAQCIAAAALGVATLATIGFQACGPAEAGPATFVGSGEARALRESSESLGKALERRKAKWSAETRRAFERDLASVNRSVRERERKAQDAPGETADAALIAAYQEKLKTLHKFAAE
jgi:predicted anti-sigma-YlaC factor YlaD